MTALTAVGHSCPLVLVRTYTLTDDSFNSSWAQLSSGIGKDIHTD